MYCLRAQLYLGFLAVLAVAISGCGGGSATANISKTTPAITWATPAAITYGTTLSSTQLNATASVAGNFVYSPAAGATLTAGSQTLNTSFTPSDTNSYNAATASVQLLVNQATPTVSAWPAASAISYGQTLASSTLTGGSASVPGSFAWTTSTSTPALGSSTPSVTFTPSDTTDYKTVTSTVSLTVNQATPTITAWPTASAISYGQTLASSTLTGGSASVGGAFTWTAPTTAPTAGTASASVTFTPSDGTDYKAVVGTVSVTVNQVTPTVSSWPTASALTYGQTLASSTLTGGSASVAGSFAWTTSSTIPTAGTPSVNVTFTPNDATNYKTVANTISLSVAQATPSVTAWPTASAISYGQTLASSTLTGGTASVAGSFVWTIPGTALSLGASTQGVTFAPTDSTDYKSVTGTASVTMNQAKPTITWTPPATIVYGMNLSTVLTATINVPGNCNYTSTNSSSTVVAVTATSTLNAGAYTLTATCTPNDTVNYTAATTTSSLTVSPSSGSVLVDYGTTLQTIRGFGGSEAWDGTQMSTTKINNLYGTTGSQLGLSMMRVRIAPLTTWSTSTLAGSTSQWNVELANALSAINAGSNVSVFATPWSAPASMKTNNSVNEGSLLSTGTTYSDYANYLQAYVQYASAKSVNLSAISMQNEPDWNPCPASDNGTGTGSGCYESCLWTAAQMDNWIANNASVLTVPLIMPESLNFNQAMSNTALNDANAVNKISIIGGHLYGSTPKAYSLATSLGKDLWMTEHTVTLAGGTGATTQSVTDAINLAEEIHSSMTVGQYNAYVYWWMENSTGVNYYSGFVDTTSNANPTYFGYAIGQFARFIRPGYKRVSATAAPVSGVYVSAYSGGGHYVIVAINSNTSASSVPFFIQNGSVTSLTPYQTTSSGGLVQGSAVAVSGYNFTYSLPAQSITTFVQ